MRELINLLNESRGLGARRRGEVFKSTDNKEEIYFRAIKFFPESGGAYESPEDFNQALNDVIDSMGGIKPIEVNKKDTRAKAFGIALFDTDPSGTGPILAYLRYFNQVNPDPTTNKWDNQTGIPNYKYAGKAAVKTQAGLMPQDVLTKLDNLTADQIVSQIANKFPNSGLEKLSLHLLGGGSLPFTFDAPSDMSFPAFRDYFCELLHPIALQMGQFTGEAAEAEKIFLGPSGFKNCLITFGGSKTEGLSDSVLINPAGQQIKVSSKGQAGAAASAGNILNAANEIASTPNGRKLLSKYKNTLDLVELIKQSGQNAAPGVLAVKFGIISPAEAQIIQDLKKIPMVSIDDLDNIGLLTKNLKKLARERETKTPDNVNLYFHLVAAVAHKVEYKINEETNFGKDAADILNHSGLVQVYTSATERGTTWTLNKFDTRYPGTAVTGVKISAHKTYYSTGIKGNFTFKILRGAADSELLATDIGEPEDTEQETPVAQPSVITGKRTEITPPGSKRDKRSDIKKGIGRERR